MRDRSQRVELPLEDEQPAPKSKRHELREWMGFISACLGIFGFLTGIHSIPALFGDAPSDRAIRHLGDLEGMRFFWPAIILSQVAYVCCAYVIIRRLRLTCFRQIEFGYANSPATAFWFVIFLTTLTCISFAFAEAIWGSVQHLERSSVPEQRFIGFMVLSGLGNFLTIVAGLFGTNLRVEP